ncbi:DNA polymerase III subunit gamma/tau [Aromatoleum toluclasticum]|uniref:DNA polymerase III subunit gamma/tau n=1 Tax=Aromatoleum toluclasticum TaxID=92003 RepID=UPI001D18787E|nr:DNA polymerase III subunit gamma/tau [Aromatoleum toluclasticum]MCC4115183.1 DNA polymerase III subunit gamma/tau [Aromatoleum toluclasticum]
MSYQVLARKWRPKSFATLVGQEHVVRALSHALATGRLHHAWLFTGTRGVGKTTISRILAKALNCETGVTAEPCNQCAACQAIDADRFPDYVEMDAASNRGVEDMAALLDKAVYAPVQGRYKVYMIDEVHMLTGHAFNAMLKTLEEPPEHVKFILATTDPQKIPVTVLSRCLQFNLKQMPQGHIVDHLSRILEAEAIPFQAPALRHLAKAANGSMRDALSLLDQAIAHGSGKVEEEQVTHMLGTVGDDHLYAVLDALIAADVTALLGIADRMEARSLSFDAALQALASLLHRVALAQFAPAAIADETERQRVLPYTEAFDAEFLQLAYQIAIHGRDELSLAPDDYAGFTMTLLRLHAFRPDQPPALGSPAAEGGGGGVARSLPPAAPRPAAVPRPAPANAGAQSAPATPARSAAPSASAPVPAAPAPVAEPVHHPAPAAASAPAETRSEPSNSVPPWEDLPPEAFAGQSAEPAVLRSEPPAEAAPPPAAARPALAALPERAPQPAPLPETASAPPAPPVATPAPQSGGDDAAADFAAGNWHGLIRRLGLGGLVREFAQHCEWLGFADGVIDLRLSNAHRHLLDMNQGVVERIQDQLASLYGAPLKLRTTVGAIAGETPAQRDEADRRARHAEAVAALESDPFVRELIERFDATLVEASVKPL